MKTYISLTSIFDKQDYLIKTLHTIKNQNVLPNKCYIYLSEEPYLLDKGFKNKKINEELFTFINSNDIFEIKWVQNIGPYRKLLFLLKEKWDEDCIILTIDDDILYNTNIVEDYINDYNKYKCCISYRGFTPNFQEKDFSDFGYNKRKNTHLKSIFNFANSGVGMVTHPSFFHKTSDLIFNENVYKSLCNTGDDIWYYFCRIANRIDTVIINKPNHFNFLSLKKECALFLKYNSKTNDETKNDVNTDNIRNVAKYFIEHNFIHSTIIFRHN